MVRSAPEETGDPGQSKVGWRCFAALIPGFTFSNVEGALVSLSLPVIQRSLEVSLEAIGWVLLMCLLPTASLSPLMGLLADRLGRRKIYSFGLLTVILGTLLAIVAPSFAFLLLARGIQGLGLSAVVANGLAIMAEQFGEDARAKAIGRMTALMAMVGVAAPVLGSVLSESYGWRAVFLLELLVVLPGPLLVLRRLPDDSRRPSARTSPSSERSIPYLTALSLVTGCSSLLIGLSLGSRLGGSAPIPLALMGLSALTLVLTGVLNRQGAPLLPLSRLPTTTGWSLFTLLLASIVMGALNFVLPLYLAHARGLKGLALGWEVLPLPIGMVLGALLSGWVCRRSVTLPIVTGLGVSMLGMLIYSSQGAWVLLTIGIGSGAYSVALNEAVLHGPDPSIGSRTGLVSLLRIVGGMLGVAFAQILLKRYEVSQWITTLSILPAPALLTAILAWRTRPRAR